MSGKISLIKLTEQCLVDNWSLRHACNKQIQASLNGGYLLKLPRIAVVGCGNWGKNLVRNFAQLGELAAICDSDEQRLTLAKQEYKGIMNHN